MSNTFGVTPLIPGLVNEVALKIFRHFVAIGWNGPFTFVLVCIPCLMGVVVFGGFVALLLGRLRMATTQAMEELASIGTETFPKDDGLATTEVTMARLCKSIKSLQCRPNPMLMENRDKAEGGICLVSFDGGGPGSMSQLRILDELMIRLSSESDVEADQVLPADYFDLMGGVGFGGFVALLLGRLRMTTTQAMEELASIGAETFPKDDDLVTTEVTMARLRKSIENMLERYGHSVDMKLRDNSGNRCKVVLFAATTTVIDHCHPFRTYRSPRKCLECTLIDAACATMATPEHFSSVAIGPRLRKQSFAGIPHGFDNPMREVLKEAQLIFSEKNPVSLVLSLGSGQRARLSDADRHVTRQSRVHCDGVARDLQHQLRGFGEYLRLNVDKGMETIELDDWHELGSIESYTDVYLEMNQITRYIDRAVQWLLQRNGSITLGQMSGTNTDCVVKFHSDTFKDYLTMEFKQMHDLVQQSGVEKITLVDAMGNNIPIPLEFCLTYNMLSDVINIYFRHQKAPGSDFVERGDYRLVNGNCRNTVGPMEWTQIEKVGLKVEMSMILRTRNEDKPKCPSCRTLFESSVTDGWAQCLFCLRQFQVETQVEARAYVQSNDAAQSEDNHLTESSVIPLVVRESKSGKPRMRERAISGEAEILRFRLFSVINIREVDETPNQPSLSIMGHGTIPPVTAYDGAHSLQYTAASPCLDTTIHAPHAVEVVKVPSPATTTTTIALTATTLSGPSAPTMSNPHVETEMTRKDTSPLSTVPSNGSHNRGSGSSGSGTEHGRESSLNRRTMPGREDEKDEFPSPRRPHAAPPGAQPTSGNGIASAPAAGKPVHASMAALIATGDDFDAIGSLDIDTAGHETLMEMVEEAEGDSLRRGAIRHVRGSVLRSGSRSSMTSQDIDDMIAEVADDRGGNGIVRRSSSAKPRYRGLGLSTNPHPGGVLPTFPVHIGQPVNSMVSHRASSRAGTPYLADDALNPMTPTHPTPAQKLTPPLTDSWALGRNIPMRQQVDRWFARNKQYQYSVAYAEMGPQIARLYQCTYLLNLTTDVTGEWKRNKPDAKESAAKEVMKILNNPWNLSKL